MEVRRDMATGNSERVLVGCDQWVVVGIGA